MAAQKMTGYPSIDKPWLKYYSKDTIDAVPPKGTIYDYIYDNNKEYLNDVALIYFKRKIKYSQFFDMVEACSHSLAALGISQGDIVTIQTLNMPQAVVLLYALSHIGTIANFIYITTSESELHDILINTKSKMYITIKNLFAKFEKAIKNTLVEHCILLSPEEEADKVTNFIIKTKSKKQPSTNIIRKNILDWKTFLSYYSPVKYVNDAFLPVVMVYTGGTTGKAKAVVLTNYNLNIVVSQYENSMTGFERGKIFLDMLPMFIAFGLTVSLHLPLRLGVKTILLLDITQTKAGDYFAKYKPTYFVAGSIHLEKIISHPKLQNTNMSFLKLLAAGGDAVPLTLENKANAFFLKHNCNCKVIVGYGMTELGATVCTAFPAMTKTGTVGIPLPKVIVKIVEPDTFDELPYNKEGEICINSPSSMLGYFNQPKETEHVLKKHPDGMIWMHTGDIGRIDEDGFVTIVGRIKRIIEIIDSSAIYHKIYPVLIEELLLKQPNISDVAVIGRPTPIRKNEPVAFIVLKNYTESNDVIKKLELAVRNNLPVWERPVEYRIIHELPRTLIGKVDYRALEKEASK